MQVKEVSDHWWAYIVECTDGSYYTGSAHNAYRRMQQHNAGTGARYTRNLGPVKLVYFEQHPDRSTAMKRELQIKKLPRHEKEKLVQEFMTKEYQSI